MNEQAEALRILSDVVVHQKYAKHLPDLKRREVWSEIVDRNKSMHLRRWPGLAEEIEAAYRLVYSKSVLPSMRMLQFSGKPVELMNNRAFNCSYGAVDDPAIFPEAMFLLLGGTGLGYSVQSRHVGRLPRIQALTGRPYTHLIGDSIVGWSEAVRALMASYFEGGHPVNFDYRDIRPKGALLKTTGGLAPGPEPLRTALEKIRAVLAAKKPGQQLESIECHDIMCHIADSVLSGGIRRAAMISLFDIDDEAMLSAKSGSWWVENPQRGRANNSAVVVRHKIRKQRFLELWERIRASGAGEPGILFSNNPDYGTNPCQLASATLLTPQGIRTMGEIQVGDTIWSGKRWTKVIRKVCTGVKPVASYITTAGVFRGTENHRVVCAGQKVEVKDADRIDVATGPAGYASCSEADPQTVMDGLVIGDGSVHHASNDLVILHIGAKDRYVGTEVEGLITRHRPGIQLTAWEVRTTVTADELPLTYQRRVPERFRRGDARTVASFLRGLYSANGSLCGGRVTLKAASLQMILDAQEMLSSIGIKSYYTTNKENDVAFTNGVYTCKQSYDLNITTDRAIFARSVGFLQDYKNALLAELVANTGQATKPPKRTYAIKRVVPEGEQEVFDITVDDEDHTYWTGGLLVSNCGEVSLKPLQFCNLTTLDASTVVSEADLLERVKAAAFIGTLQAAYTDFTYLRPQWRETTEDGALLGVSMTGLASGPVLGYDLSKAARTAKAENRRVAKLIGIRPADRVTCMKPEGTTSAMLGCASGVHSWYDRFAIRRITVNKNENLYHYLANTVPDLLEDCAEKPDLQAKLSLPIRAPEGALLRSEETALQLLERVRRVYTGWVKPGHRSGDNTNNVSATIDVREHEWDEVGEWMWENRRSYNGLSVLPYDGGTYVQMPFESCSEARYKEMLRLVRAVDVSKVKESQDATDLGGEQACGGGGCERL